jgi:hypothetical protein
VKKKWRKKDGKEEVNNKTKEREKERQPFSSSGGSDSFFFFCSLPISPFCNYERTSPSHCKATPYCRYCSGNFNLNNQLKVTNQFYLIMTM